MGPIVIAHRGGAGRHPENTLPAFHWASHICRAPMIEMDVHATRDGVPVILHDFTINRTTNGKGRISKLSHKEIAGLKNGLHYFKKWGKDPTEEIRIPTLEDALKLCPNVQLAIEVKPASKKLVCEIVALVQKYNAEDRCIIGSEFHTVFQELEKNYPHIRRFCSLQKILEILFDYSLNRKGRLDPGCIASLPLSSMGIKLNSKAFIDYLHQRQIEVFYWTVNDIQTAEILAKRGADGIVTDYPDILLGFFNSKDN